ncbi:glycine cleavage system aminomethyltransferase GcvT [Arthrobacter sp. Leaf69]|uniref:glycine cleavage system aminomethyltransferase GcvT n=1 Tax=Arthrobacter sp. Leaf69 TaxID=1736232 RepID=UPI0006F7ACE5|nr:glycine cleavage system aminomethyltransferase GcvT [Arthrobacter sp. Leaf69]KQN86614.1 glycine cleavage system protein T [Arthrobacter sp. Leaf69]
MSEKYTALYEEHKQLGASFTDFGGWQMPLKYSSELAEHHAVRNAAGLFDLSHMGEVWVTGPDAAAFLDYALVGKLSAIADGKAKYSLICNADGGIVDDLITYRFGDEKYLVVPNAGNAPTVAAALAERARSGKVGGFDVIVGDVSAEMSLVAVQGPKAEAILLKLTDEAQHALVTDLKYYAFNELTVAGHDVILARTGYTGEDGFELFVANNAAAPLWASVAEAGAEFGIVPCGLASRDSLRLEAGMPLYGNELSLERSPFDAGLGPVVALKSKEGDFVGRSALEADREAGSKRKLVGLKGLGRRAGRGGYPVLKDGNVVGEVTSGQPSPTLGYPVAMAYVDVEFTELGTALDIDLRGKAEPFEVVALPFYKRQK